jgi:transcriptional regulator
LTIKSEQLEWRRGKVIELRARGLSYAEIASELQVPKTAVAEDMLYLRKRAKESIKEYVTEHLPEQYQIALRALDTILKHAYEILQQAHDNREKVAALELFKNTHMTKLELLGNATTIDHALEYIRSKQSGGLKAAKQAQTEEQAVF